MTGDLLAGLAAPSAETLAEGAVLAEGTPGEIVTNADVRKVYLGEHFRM